ncbi:MAG: MBL fold metallo-hydrolase [Candidatus Buchananbacteria bacterium]|nr:MBL fold metallo-hydrolase [Candidatus Buchananbacteria bacterium]
MNLHFYGGAKVVTGANYLIEVGKTKILVDCGMFQGPEELADLNYEEFPYDPKKINYVFITHSHLDHCGRLPKLVKAGFKGKIICTPPTRDLMAVALADSSRLLEREALQLKREPLYTETDLLKMLTLIKAHDYDKKVKLNQSLTFRLKEAGHILGSSMVELWLTEGKKKIKITFTGDLGNPPTPLLKQPAKIDRTDYLVIESAYGDRLHESRKERKIKLERTIEDVISRKGILMIPSFAIERTQELLYELNDLVENARIPRVPVFIDSPLAIKITDVYKKHQKYFNRKTRYIINSGDDIFSFPGLDFTPTKQESKDILHVPPPKIIIAGSGMSTGGRIIFHEKEYLPDPNNLFLVIGFQVEGTLGRKILEGIPVVKILGQHVKNKAEIRAIGGYSAHADKNQLLDFISQIKKPIKKVFPVQGERKAAESLRKSVESKLNIDSEVPKFEQIIEL